MGISCELLIFTTILAILLLISGTVKSQEVEDESEFSYESGSESGPERWGEIRKDWAACGKGRMQSPIDLCDKRVKVLHCLGRLRRSYRPSNAVMENRGHDIMLKWQDGAGGIWLNGTEYVLNQVHWHTPSEHTVNGRRYSLELHMVHESAGNKTAVVGILYKIGRADTFLAELEGYIKKLEKMGKDEEEKVGLVDPRDMKRGSRKYYRYMGSLTTPPCTEGVVWTIVRKVRTVSREQLQLLRDAVHDGFEENARPTQKINGRIIGFYRPRKVQH